MPPMELRFEETGLSADALFFGRTRAGSRARAGFLLALASIAAVFAAMQAWDARAQLAQVRQALQESRQRAITTRAAHTGLQPAERDAWERVVRQLNIPWTDLFEALERATPEQIAIVSIEPQTRQGSLRLQAEAKTLDAVLEYASNLRAHEAFGEVALLKHETNEQDASRPLRISLEVHLKAADGARVTGTGAAPR